MLFTFFKNILILSYKQKIFRYFSRRLLQIPFMSEKDSIVNQSAHINSKRGCFKSRTTPFATDYFDKKYYLNVATNIIVTDKIVFKEFMKRCG